MKQFFTVLVLSAFVLFATWESAEAKSFRNPALLIVSIPVLAMVVAAIATAGFQKPVEAEQKSIDDISGSKHLVWPGDEIALCGLQGSEGLRGGPRSATTQTKRTSLWPIVPTQFKSAQ